MQDAEIQQTIRKAMRALVLILDGVGVGNANDAAAYDDRGADTLGHIFLHRQTLELPHLFSLGLGQILSGNVGTTTDVRAGYGRMRPASTGKDTLAGHWEIAGVIVKEPFAVYEIFPDTLVDVIERDANIEFVGNCAQNGNEILEEFGEIHFKQRNPILFTSGDSVMQIAAHEEIIPRKRLYEICRVARRHCNALRIGRVIARPFTGTPGHFASAAGRHDFPIVPPRTVLNAISETGLAVEGVGKISDIFAHSGITRSHRTSSNGEGMKTVEKLWSGMHDGLIFANLADFDTLHGHRRDLHGFAGALTEFDAWLGGFLPEIESEDLVIITADHGNDPTFRGTGHTREEVPLIALSNGHQGSLGVSETFSDVGATLMAYFGLEEKWPVGRSLFHFNGKRPRPFHL